MSHDDHAQSESAFLLKAKLEEGLKNYWSARNGEWRVRIENEKKTVTEIKTYLSAGSEILLRRLGDRESEAAEFFKKGITLLEQLREQYERAAAAERKRQAEKRKREEAEREAEQKRLQADWKREVAKWVGTGIGGIGLFIAGILLFVALVAGGSFAIPILIGVGAVIAGCAYYRRFK